MKQLYTDEECVSAWYVGQREEGVRSVGKGTETDNIVQRYD